MTAVLTPGDPLAETKLMTVIRPRQAAEPIGVGHRHPAVDQGHADAVVAGRVDDRVGDLERAPAAWPPSPSRRRRRRGPPPPPETGGRITRASASGWLGVALADPDDADEVARVEVVGHAALDEGHADLGDLPPSSGLVRTSIDVSSSWPSFEGTPRVGAEHLGRASAGTIEVDRRDVGLAEHVAGDLGAGRDVGADHQHRVARVHAQRQQAGERGAADDQQDAEQGDGGTASTRRCGGSRWVRRGRRAARAVLDRVADRIGRCASP